MREGEIVSARVTSVHEYGIFLAAEGLIGFVQIPDLSWTEGVEPGDVAVEGEALDVRVLKVGEGRFSASIKHVRPDLDPWARAETYHVGSEHLGTVTKLLDWGIVIAIGTGAKGVVIGHCDGVGLGDPVRVVVVTCDAELRKLEFRLLPAGNTSESD